MAVLLVLTLGAILLQAICGGWGPVARSKLPEELVLQPARVAV